MLCGQMRTEWGLLSVCKGNAGILVTIRKGPRMAVLLKAWRGMVRCSLDGFGVPCRRGAGHSVMTAVVTGDFAAGGLAGGAGLPTPLRYAPWGRQPCPSG
jgi:hypothetical protein